MYLSDIIEHLRQELPRYSERICDSLSIASISFTGGTVTVETATAHGLVNNEIVTIIDCFEKIPINSISVSDGIASVETSLDHDLTLDYIDPSKQPPIEIVECSVDDFNSDELVLTSVTNRRNFKFTYGGVETSATDGYLVQDSYNRYNGLKTITVIDSTHFSYSALGLSPTAIPGTVQKSIRISGSINIERLIDSYTKQATDKFFLFVLPAGTSASKSRDVPTDATANHATGISYRQLLIPKIEVYMFVPCSAQISGRQAYDLVIEESVYLFKSMLGYSVQSPYSDTSHKIIYESDAPFLYNGSLYIHVFNFSSLFILNSDDIMKIEGDRAHRDCSFDIFREDNVDALETTINLDEGAL